MATRLSSSSLVTPTTVHPMATSAFALLESRMRLFSPSWFSLLWYSTSSFASGQHASQRKLFLCEMAHAITGIDIHPGASVGEAFFIDHGTGVVIGETCVIGRGCRLYQGVTLGALSFPKGADGVLIKGIPRHPKLEDDVTVYAGATILGNITIGAGSVIGANTWVTRDVPRNSKVVSGD